MENTGISWADNTHNGWIGCTKVSEGEDGGCVFCYAERDMDHRFHRVNWGPGKPRVLTTDANWKKPLAWNAAADDFFAKHGHWPRVFSASLSDIFDNEVPQAWRDRLWELVRATPKLRWMLLSKRIGNAHDMLPQDFPRGFEHAGFMATVVNQKEWDRDKQKLMAVKHWGASWVGLSIEPMMGRIDLGGHAFFLDYVICGGESGPHARPNTMPDDVRFLEAQCDRNRTAFHFKQWGEWGVSPSGYTWQESEALADGRPFVHLSSGESLIRYGREQAGRKLDGRIRDAILPAALA
jgi:protein gp37